MKRHVWVLCLLVLVGAVTYSNSLHSNFLIDDHVFFDEKMRNIKYILYQFVPDKNEFLNIEGQRQDSYYRPLAHVLPMLAFSVFRNNMLGLHAVNLGLLVLAMFVLYLFVAKVFGNWQLGVLTAVFYMVHPINGIIVNYVTASVFAVQVILMLVALYFVAIDGKRTNQGHAPGLFKGVFNRPLGYCFSVLFYLLAIMCHETAMALPFYAMGLLIFGSGDTFKDALKKTAVLWIFLALYFWFRLNHANINNSIIHHYVYYHMNLFEYGATFTKLILWYLSKLFYPCGIVMIWAVPVLRQGLGWWWLALAALLGGFFFLLHRFRSDRVVQLGLVWFLIGFLPATMACMFQPAHGMMVEPHWFVFSVICFLLIIARMIIKLFDNAALKSNFTAFLVGILAVFVIVVPWVGLSRIDNNLWSNEKRYCYYWLGETPGFSAVIFHLAKSYELDRQYTVAREYYRQALALHYRAYLVYMNLGLIDIMEGKWDMAKQDCLAALAIDPNLSIVLNNMGLIYLKNNDDSEAEKYFRRAMACDRFMILPRLNVAAIQERHKDIRGAVETLQGVLDIDPYDENALIALLKIYLGQKDQANTLDVAQRLTQSRNPETLTNVGIIFAFFHQYDKALAIFEHSIQMEPRYLNAYVQATELLAQQHQFERAFVMCQQGLSVSPRDKVLNNLLKRLSAVNGI